MLRIALSGNGSATRRGHIPSISTLEEMGQAKLVAIQDPEPSAPPGGLRLPIASHVDLEDMLDSLNPDLLVVASPPTAHAHAIVEATRRGVDVLCEKPVALTADDVRHLELLRQRGSWPMVLGVHQYRHSAGWTYVRPLISQAISDRRPFEVKVIVRRRGFDSTARTNWRADPDEGGAVTDHVTHYVALVASAGVGLHVDCIYGARNSTVNIVFGCDGADGVSLGQLDVTVDYGTSERSNLVEFSDDVHHCIWLQDSVMVLRNSDRLSEYTCPALSDRGYVDSLYSALYGEIVTRYQDESWRDERMRESVATGRCVADALAYMRAL